MVSRQSLGLHVCDYDVYFGIVFFILASSSYCFYKPHFFADLLKQYIIVSNRFAESPLTSSSQTVDFISGTPQGTPK